MRPVGVVTVAVTPSALLETVELWFLLGGCWQAPLRLSLSENAGAGSSLDRRLREMTAMLEPRGKPDVEHLSILIRWHGASWRDGEWLGFESLEKIPYRKLVNAISRVATRTLKLEMDRPALAQGTPARGPEQAGGPEARAPEKAR